MVQILIDYFQDLGNVNFSFFTARELYDRKENLALIVKVLHERWKLDVEASPRDDILIDGKFKISFLFYGLKYIRFYFHDWIDYNGVVFSID